MFEIIITILLIFTLVGVVILYRTNGSNDSFTINQLNKVEEELENTRLKNETINKDLATANSEIIHLNDKLKSQKEELENLNKTLKIEFENLANSILENNSEKFSKNNQKQLDTILTPLKKQIDEFKNKVEETEKSNIERGTRFEERLKELQSMYNQSSEETINLTKALRGDVKKQGSWGEIKLERILEISDLSEGVEYEKQQSFQESENRLQPDILIKLPKNKHIIIDSKVSLNAYSRYIETDKEDEKKEHLKQLITDIKNHITGLQSKDYQYISSIDTPEYVLMFVPIEATFALSLEHDNTLFSFAWDKKIVLVSPTTLLAVLKTVSSIWMHEKQTQNINLIIDKAGKMYDKFASFVQDMYKIGDTIDRSRRTYADAINKLKEGKGNLVRRAQEIKELGAKTKKNIPETSNSKQLAEDLFE